MDKRLRELQRRASIEGSQAQAASLRYALRVGKLDPIHIQIASFLGHEASQILYPDAFPTGIPFEALANHYPLTLLLPWAALKCCLHLWEDDERTQFLKEIPVAPCIPDFRVKHHQDVAVDLMPIISELNCHQWPRFALDCVEKTFLGELTPEHLDWLDEIHSSDVAHGPQCMNRFYYLITPIEKYTRAINNTLDHSDLVGFTGAGYLTGFWTTDYEFNLELPVLLGFYRKAKAVYNATVCISDAFFNVNRDDPELQIFNSMRFNDSGGLRSITQPTGPQPYVDFTYWQNLHIEAAAPYAIPYLLEDWA